MEFLLVNYHFALRELFFFRRKGISRLVMGLSSGCIALLSLAKLFYFRSKYILEPGSKLSR